MYGYRCIVTSKNVWICVLCSLRVTPYWNFEKMTIYLPIQWHWSLPLCPKSLKIDLAVNSLLEKPLTIQISSSLWTFIFFCKSTSTIYNIILVLIVNSAFRKNSPFNKRTRIFVMTEVKMLWTHEAAQWTVLINMLKNSQAFQLS